MEKLKKFETHLHTLPLSVCSRLTAAEAVAKYRKCGFDGMVLTNHYSRRYMETTGASESEWKKLYVQAFHDFRDEAEKAGMEAFFGAEVTLYLHISPYYKKLYSDEYIMKNYADYLIVGVTDEFILDMPLLCDMSLADLHEVCAHNGMLLIQAHPFRSEQFHAPKDLSLLDGLEINGNLGFPSGPNEQAVLSLAREHDLVVTCGGDVHYDWTKLVSATFIPEHVHDSTALAAYLREVKIPKYSFTEPDDNPLPKPDWWRY